MWRRIVPVVALLCALAACSSGDDDAERADGATTTDRPAATTTVAPESVVDVATLNVLHGLFCPEETDYCHAPDRMTMMADELERIGCPELVGLQEVSSRQEELFEGALAKVCDGAYRVASAPTNELDVAVVLTSLDIVDQGVLDIANFPWEAYWVRVSTSEGPVDFLTTHFASSSNNPPCDATRCPTICADGIETNECHAVEVVDHFDQVAQPAAITVVAGDLNARHDDPTLATFTDAGFEDAWLSAGRPQCDPEGNDDERAACTAGRPRPENALDGLDVDTGRYESRIDYVLVRGDGDCEPEVGAIEVFAREPLAEPFEGLYWPSDHAGVVAALGCR
jgi:endonuclease/exonuclease/phosphatase family metal-dependent hydrolase